ncbi:MAG: amidohydrolase family protein [Clostridiales Family XIII bacterium]|jgi:predicted TIM-barrel fold metal-dependent hydrolase|nr:amidohydrolase family protein [Clostridiales Family XIII bacterium]
MRVDIHTHLWPPERTSEAMRANIEARGLSIDDAMSADGLLSAEAGVADAVVIQTMAFDGGRTNEELEVSHRYAAAAMKARPGEIYAFCNINPAALGQSQNYLRRYIENEGFIGLKMHQNVQEVYANDEWLFPLYERMQEYGLPIMYHTGSIGLTPFFDKYSDISAIDEVACRFPGLPIIMGHAGRGRYVEIASVLRKHENVYADISTNFARQPGREYELMAELIKTVKLYTGTTEKLLFGTDYPFYRPSDTAALIDRAAAAYPNDITAVDADAIKNSNAAAFLTKYGCVRDVS